MTARVMIVVTHLLGTGHLTRALTLGRAFAAAGHAVDVVSGGLPARHLDTTGIDLHQLPPLRSDGTDFARLLAPDAGKASAEHLAARRNMLTDLVQTREPDILITELFPFGRRALSDEFLALLDTAESLSQRPRLLASVRDILAPPSKPAKQSFAEEIVARYYDAVLVHSDPTVTRLETSWRVTEALRAKLRYTGFVAPPLPTDAATDGAGEVLVSAGGGSVGNPVFSAAIEAARHSDLRWRLLVGGLDAPARVTTLAAGAPANVTVEPARPDFRAMLRHAAASVSHCGYNTAMDILQTGVPAVIVPFDDGGEVEQSMRARALADLPGIEPVPLRALDGPALLAAFERAREAPPRSQAGFRFDGAQETVRISMEILS